MLLEVQCEVYSQCPQSTYQFTRKFKRTSCFLLLTTFMEMLISFSSRTWHLPTLPKVPKVGSMTMVLLVLDWPANSPDLNPIKNLWGIIKRKMRDTRPNNTDDLKAAIKATWAFITPEQCHRLIVFMPHRIDSVIHAKGSPTKEIWNWVLRNEHTFQKPDIAVENIFF